MDLLIVAALAAILILAVRRVVRSRGTCHCDGDCSRCGKRKAAH